MRGLYLSLIILILGCERNQKDLNPSVGRVIPTEDASSRESREKCEKKSGRAYLDFDGNDLSASRKDLKQGYEQMRLKPYPVLKADLTRLFKKLPKSFATQGLVFGQPERRWHRLPEASAPALFVIYDTVLKSFKGYTADTDFSWSDKPAIIEEQCQKFVNQAFPHSNGEPLVKHCQEMVQDKKVHKDIETRWAHAFATLLITSQFLGY